jgi:anti-anti-sigma factor
MLAAALGQNAPVRLGGIGVPELDFSLWRKAMATPLQHISADHDRGALVLTINLRRLDDYELAEEMGRELIEAAQPQAGDVIVDMRNVEYMASVGYGPLVSLRGRVRQSGGRLILCNLAEVIKQMFEATHLLINPKSPHSLFEYAANLDEALTLAKSPR